MSKHRKSFGENVPPETFDEVLKQLEDEWNRLHTRYEVYFACGHV